MKIVAIIVVVVVIALFFLLPILNAPEDESIIPEDISASQIGEFIGGLFRYWIDVLKAAFSTLIVMPTAILTSITG